MISVFTAIRRAYIYYANQGKSVLFLQNMKTLKISKKIIFVIGCLFFVAGSAHAANVGDIVNFNVDKNCTITDSTLPTFHL